jgi:soluble lytic murein transglycosylase-like protein
VSVRYTFVLRLALVGMALALYASPAAAQIYSWRDASGTLVLSDHRPGSATAVTSYAVPEADAVRTTRSVAASQRPDAYDDVILEHARRNNVRQSLVRAVIQVESAFNPYARSPKGAMGLMQLMPATAQQFGVKNPYDPEQNVGAGVAYLRQLLDRYDGNEELALAAYNAGPGAVDRHGESVPPYRETQQYVAKINKIAGSRAPRAAGTSLYRTVDIIDGRVIIKYTDKRPE